MFNMLICWHSQSINENEGIGEEYKPKYIRRLTREHLENNMVHNIWRINIY